MRLISDFICDIVSRSKCLNHKYLFICGPGSNGLDGIFTAHKLLSLGYKIEILNMKKNSNLSYIEKFNLKDRLVSIQRVTKVTKGGRAFGFSAIVIVGNEEGVVGHGLGKAKEVSIAISKAVEDAKKNLVKIPLFNSTIPHEQKGKHGGARVYIQPASQGTGVIAGGAVRAVLEAVGVQDVLSKSQGSSNPHNVVKATFDALFKLRDANKVAQERGISLDKVFNG